MPKTTFSYAPAYYGNPSSGAAALPAQKAAMQAIHNGLIATGLVQLSDTGQLDIDALPVNASSGPAQLLAGYRIYEMVDDLTPTLRVVIKVEFYRCNVGQLAAQFFEVMVVVTVGHATDGAGAFVGPSIQAGVQTLTTSSSRLTPPALVPSYMCWKDHTFLMAVGIGFAQINATTGKPVMAGFAVISRTRDANGVADGRGVVCYGCQEAINLTQFNRRLRSSVSIPSMSLAVQSIPDLTGFSGAYFGMASVGGAPQVQFPLAAVPKIYPFTSLGMVRGGSGFSAGDIAQLDIDGATREFICLGDVSLYPSVVGPTTIVEATYGTGDVFYGVGLLMLYET